MTDNLLELVTQIKTTLNDAFDALKRNLEFYREAGRLLTKARTQLFEHNMKPWEVWVQSSEGPGIQPRVAQLYMRLHKNWAKIQKDPEFKPDMSYTTALKLIRKKYPKKKKVAVVDVDGPVQPESVIPLPKPQNSVPSDEPPNPQTGNETSEIEDNPRVPLPTPRIYPAPEEQEVAEQVVSKPTTGIVKVQITGEADLLISPSEGYTLDKVLELITNKEGSFQEHNETITTSGAKVIATFITKVTDWNITNVVAKAA